MISNFTIFMGVALIIIVILWALVELFVMPVMKEADKLQDKKNYKTKEMQHRA